MDYYFDRLPTLNGVSGVPLPSWVQLWFRREKELVLHLYEY